MRVVDQVDLIPAFPARPDKPGQLQLRQMLADRLQRTPYLPGQAANITFPLGQDPNDVQPHRGGKQAELARGVLQQLRRQIAAARSGRDPDGHVHPLQSAALQGLPAYQPAGSQTCRIAQS